MSDANINAMDVKQLRNEVQLLRDELAIMQRKYEDILYNLDYNNFSSRLVQEKDDMKTQISITAEGIETKVSKDEFESEMKQTAESIATKVSHSELNKYSTQEQTAAAITSIVSEYQTRAEAEDAYDELYSKIEQTAGSITSTVSKSINSYFVSTLPPTKDAEDAQKAMLCLYDDKYYYYNEKSEKWEEYPYGGFQTVFKQTETNFELDGKVIITDVAQIDGNLHIGKLFSGAKSIIFNDAANISTCGGDGSVSTINPTGIAFNCTSIHFKNLSTYTDGSPLIWAGTTLLATQDWVQSKFNSGEAGGTAVAVFG